jgi:YD repeat-containing protein
MSIAVGYLIFAAIVLCCPALQRLVGLIVLGLIVMLSLASAGEQRLYDAQGRSLGTATPLSGGAVEYRDAAGRVTGRSSTDSQGTTTFYNSSGQVTGRASGPAKPHGNRP